MSYKDLVLLCKNIRDINISNVHAGNYRTKCELGNRNYTIPILSIKNGRVHTIVVINSYESITISEVFNIEIILTDNDAKIIHDAKETNLSYDILNEDYDETYYVLKLGRYELDFEYKILYSIYLELRLKYGS